VKLSIRWNKVSIVAVAMTGILAAVFIAPLLIGRIAGYRSAQLHPHPASDAEQLEIMRRILKEEFFASWQLPPLPRPPPLPPEPYEHKSIVLIGSSLGMCEKPSAANHPEFGCISVSDRDRDIRFVQDEPGIPPTLLQELFAASRIASTIPDPHVADILYRPRAVMDGLTGSDAWNQFYARFPHSKFAIEFSRAVLSDDGTHALIHVQIRFIAEQGVLYYLERTGNTWRVEKASGPTYR
jgi:hypothetical protein